MKFLRYALVVPFLLAAAPASAATLSFVSGAGYEVGDTVSVSVAISSAQAINAAGASVNYPADKLELVSISKAASIINFWAQEPAGQGAGSMSFQGIVFDPGYTGVGGRVVQLIFRAKAAGPAVLSFSDAQVLANDGMGTNVLSSASPVSLAIAPAAEAPAKTPAVQKPATTPVSTPATEATTAPAVAEPQTPAPKTVSQESWYQPLSQFAERNAPLLWLMLALLALVFFLGWLIGAGAAAGHSRRFHSRLGVHKEFNALKGAVLEELQGLEKVRTHRELTAQEEKLFKRLSRLIERTEEKIADEIDHALAQKPKGR